MGRFYSFPTFNSGGEGKANGAPQRRKDWPTTEQLEARYPEHYKHRDDPMTSNFAEVGDEFKIHGDPAKVRHVEKNSDGSQELTVQRSSQRDSGTYKVKVEPTSTGKTRTQHITKLKRSFD